MAGGRKGGEQTTEINDTLRRAARPLVGQAGQVADLPYMPNRGIQFAGFSPMQTAAFDNTNSAANAFGLNTGAGQSYLPPTETQGNISGYSTGGVFDNARNASLPPAYQDYLASFFINPNSPTRRA
jgi:hypothetical protein